MMNTLRDTLSLDGTWSVNGPREIALQGSVPGCAHSDLRREGLIPDPYFRDNEKRLQWVGESDWTYRRSFQVPQRLLDRDQVLLRCQGLDTFAEIRLNGKRIGKTDNMFRQWEFDVKQTLQLGKNEIEVRFRSTIPYATRQQKKHFLWHTGIDHHRISGGNWVRKEQCNYGWDWGPMLATCGIWRSIGIVGIDTAELEEVYVRQDHRRGGAVDLGVSARCRMNGRRGLRLRCVVTLKGAEVASVEAAVKRGLARVCLRISQPELWWPNGLGEQPLYDVAVSLVDGDGNLHDREVKRIGLRRLQLVRREDRWGESFHFEANGRAFFAKGANWIPADTFDADATDERCRALLEDAKAANMNMIRVWGGGKYERDAFYSACDELGLCVWQDFMFGCSAYPAFDDEFMSNVKVEAEQNVKRLRHHACLALWCGNNELEQIKPIIGDEPGQMTWKDYKRLFDDLIAKVVAENDPDTAYWPSSEHSPVGDRTFSNNPDCGDAHLWAVWHGRQPFEWYRGSYHRFCSEFGFQSFPEPRTVEAYTDPEDRNVTTHVMEAHQRSPIGNSAIIDYMLSWFRLPVGFENTVWLSQVLQGLAIKYAVEHWRRNRPRCMGALYWQLNDCWPVASWASIDYFHRWKALHYEARRFFAPLLVSGVEDLEKKRVDVFVSNDGFEAEEVEVAWRVVSVEGKTLQRGSKAVRAKAGGTVRAERLDLSDLLEERGPRRLLVALELKQGRRVVGSNLVTFARPKHMELRDPEVEVKIKPKGKRGYTVSLKAKAPALWLWLETAKAEVRYSDNFLHVLPGKTTKVDVMPAGDLSLEQLEKELRARSVFDTYQEG